MIYDRWGAPVEVLGGNLEFGEVHVRAPSYEEPRYKLTCLRATGGVTEVPDAVRRANDARNSSHAE